MFSCLLIIFYKSTDDLELLNDVPVIIQRSYLLKYRLLSVLLLSFRVLDQPELIYYTEVQFIFMP